MADIHVDYAPLEQLTNEFDTVIKFLNNAQETADSVSGAIPNQSVASAVRNFEDGWKSKRSKMIQVFSDKNQATQLVIEKFKEADNEASFVDLH
jgi:NifB/MoaA-like Fe-S oxidoreductase